jgi:magnesium chelatase subunit I
MPLETRYPFTAIVGQDEMRDALILAAINPRIQGVLLIGGKGTGKTTAVRGLVDLLPSVNVSTCENGYGCRPEMLLTEPEAVCASCKARLARGESITSDQPQRVIELPLNVMLEDVVGGLNRRLEIEQRRFRFEPGILSYAHGNILYIDEINLLPSDVLNSILDAAAMGFTIVRRGMVVSSYPSRFVLIGSMNPEEGELRPQLLDRMGLRVYVNPVNSVEERIEVYRRYSRFSREPESLIAQYAAETEAAQAAISQARARVDSVTIAEDAARAAIRIIQQLAIDSHRTEIVLFEAARALAAFEGRDEVTIADVISMAPMALRLRRSVRLHTLLQTQQAEAEEIGAAIAKLTPARRRVRSRKMKDER